METIDFTLRLYKDTVGMPGLSSLRSITISDITLVSKPCKFGDVCMHKGNQRKHKYTIELSKKFSKVAGSHSSPILHFNGEYIDIIVKNFPRYPAFYQCKHEARNILTGWASLGIHDGFPIQLQHRKLQIF